MEYPVFAYKVAEKGRFYAFQNHARLSRTSTRLLGEGIFDNVHFIDALGDHYVVMGVRKIKWGTLFWGYSLIYKGRAIIVNFNLSKLSNESIASMKRLILVDQRGDEMLDNEIISMLSKASTIRSIIEIFY